MPRLLRVSAGTAVVLAVVLTAYFAVTARPVGPARPALTSTDPADGATLAQAPTEVELAFTAPLVPDLSHMSVQDRSGTTMDLGRSYPVSPERLRQPVNITAGGQMTVAYHVTFTGGAELVGTLHFTVGTGEAADPSAASTDDAAAAMHGDEHGDGHGVDPISAALLAIDSIVALAAIMLFMLRPRRS